MNAHRPSATRSLIRSATRESFRKLDPRVQLKNPVMFVVFLCSTLCTLRLFVDLLNGQPVFFDLQITLWLWFTVLFANFAEAVAEGRGKAQADSLRKSRQESLTERLLPNAPVNLESPCEVVASTQLRTGDRVKVLKGGLIPLDGEVIWGVASVDESAITGESAPVLRESGGDRSAVTGGTRVVSDALIIRITVDPGSSFLDRMIAMVEGASRKPTPNEVALGQLLVALTLVFLLAVGTLKGFALFAEKQSGLEPGSTASFPVLVALLVCLIPTTIGGLLSAIGISGIDRMVRKNVIATSGKAVEAAGDIDVLLLDKTGTITYGNRRASAFLPVTGVDEAELGAAAWLSSLGDETPEGRSTVSLAHEKWSRLPARYEAHGPFLAIPFSAHTRMSGCEMDLSNGTHISVRKGAVDAMIRQCRPSDPRLAEELENLAVDVAREGATPLAVSLDGKLLGIVVLKDIVKVGIKDRFAELRRMGIRTVMITGDNPLTAASIAAEAGVDDFLAEATPERKLQKLREEQSKGHMVGMIGDGTNDAPALAQADVGVAMNTGTQAAREAGNMVDLDSDPTKLIEIVETGKQLLLTRGALTTFSIANDVAKYFAIIPAMFSALYVAPGASVGPLARLNIMGLASPHSAILSAVIFNALIIIALIPLALRGVSWKPLSARQTLTRNVALWGVGGIVAPFIGIKVIDIIVHALHLA